MGRTRKPMDGSDRGKLATGETDKPGVDMEHQHQKDEENGSGSRLPICAYADVLDRLMSDLEAKGFYMYPNPVGDFCCWDVYKKSFLDIEGLEVPEGFTYQKQIRARDPIARANFLAVVRHIAEGHRYESSGKEAGVWEKVVLAFEDDLNNPKNQVARIGQSRTSGEYRKVTLNGTSGAFKIVPKAEWFPEAIQQVNARKLLTLFPDAEARQLMLILGRAMAGATETETAEGMLYHTTRSYGLIVGHTAGMGKSTLLNYISNAVAKLGYNVSTVATNDTRFGWGEVACSDLAILDDLTDDIQRRLLHDAKVKTIVSNGWMKVEEKGVNAVSVKASTVFLWATNVHNPSHYIGMDEGSISRLNQLDTYAPHELQTAYPDIEDARILPYWKKLAEDTGTSTDVLAMWLLRQSLDYFLTSCGYYFDEDGQLAKDDSADYLEEVIKTNRKDFRIDVGLGHAEELPTTAAHLVAMAISTARACDVKKLMVALDRLDYNPDLLIQQLRVFLVEGEALNRPELEPLRLKRLSASVKKYIEAKVSDFDRLHVTRSSSQSFGVIVEELVSTNGFKYPQKSSQYQPYWIAAKRLIPIYIQRYQSLFNDPDFDCNPSLASSLDAVLASMRGLLK